MSYAAPTGHHKLRCGASLIDLLIVIAIIGLLINLTLPAIQSSRESARRMACANNLRQVGMAMQMHHDAHSHLPANGWGFQWVGDPDRGFRSEQPGGWIFNTLPFMEQSVVRDIAANLEEESIEKRQAMARMLSTVVAGWNCPERREPGLYSTNDPYSPFNSETVYAAARSDFAANGGADHCLLISKTPIRSSGPESVEQFKEELWREEYRRLRTLCDGVVVPAHYVAYRQITDGTSKTYLVGEKSTHSDHYQDGRSQGDEYSLYTGANIENTRLGLELPRMDSADSSGSGSWGSAHPSGLNMVYCDGSLRTLSYDVDKDVHIAASGREDGEVVAR